MTLYKLETLVAANRLQKSKKLYFLANLKLTGNNLSHTHKKYSFLIVVYLFLNFLNRKKKHGNTKRNNNLLIQYCIEFCYKSISKGLSDPCLT